MVPVIKLVAHTHISGVIDGHSACADVGHAQISGIIDLKCSARDAAGDDSGFGAYIWQILDHNWNSLSSLKYFFNLCIYFSQIANSVVAYSHANYYVAFICLLFPML